MAIWPTLMHTALKFSYIKNVKKQTLVHGFCFYKLFPMGCVGLRQPPLCYSHSCLKSHCSPTHSASAGPKVTGATDTLSMLVLLYTYMYTCTVILCFTSSYRSNHFCSAVVSARLTLHQWRVLQNLSNAQTTSHTYNSVCANTRPSAHTSVQTISLHVVISLSFFYISVVIARR